MFDPQKSLANRDIADTYTVTGQDTTGVAEGVGFLGYTLVVLNDAKIGDKVEFEVRPGFSQ